VSRRARRRLGGIATTLVLLSGACSSPRRGPALPVAGHPPPPGLYVAIGASETRGVGTDNPVREAWPQDMFRVLPSTYALVNLGISGATVADALRVELPQAVSLHPTLVTVWLNVNDLLNAVPARTYGAELSELLHGLRATGATVLVANTPPLDQLPAYLACEDPAHHPGPCSSFVPRPIPSPAAVAAAVDAYNTTIAEVSAGAGAVVVDLHAAGVAARAQGGADALVSGDGFHPNALGAQRVADSFAAAWRATTRPAG